MQSDSNNFQTKCFHQILESGWYQHVNSETRLRQGQNASLLDLILTNEESMVNNLKILNPIGRSDHCVLIFNLVTKGLLDKKIGIPKYYQGRYDEMRHYFSQKLWEIDQDQNLSEIWNLFQNKITMVTDKFIPVHKPGTKKGRIGAIVIQLGPSNTNTVPEINTTKTGLQRSGIIMYELETVQLHKLNRQRDYMKRK